MSTQTIPPPRARQYGTGDGTEPETAEPARQASRFDQRGIALQTVIIMVVLLAIAGSVAAVLFSRAQDATDELQSASIVASPYAARTADNCTRAGGKWMLGTVPAGAHRTELRSVNKAVDTDADMTGWDANGKAVNSGSVGWCKPN